MEQMVTTQMIHGIIQDSISLISLEMLILILLKVSLEVVDRNAGCDGDHELVLGGEPMALDLLEKPVQVLRFYAKKNDVSAAEGFDRVGARLNAKVTFELTGPFGAANGHHDLRGGKNLLLEQPSGDGRSHVAAANDRESFVFHSVTPLG